MNFRLRKKEKEKINTLIKTFEKNTHSELLIVINKKSDPYPAASLRFGISMSLVLTFTLSIFIEFQFTFFLPLISFILFFFFNLIGRMNFIQKYTLTQNETIREVEEKAYETFFLMGPNKTTHRATSMIYFSILERKIHILVDQVLFKEMNQDDLKKIIDILEQDFSNGDFYDGFETAIESLERLVIYYFPNKVLDELPCELSNTITHI